MDPGGLPNVCPGGVNGGDGVPLEGLSMVIGIGGTRGVPKLCRVRDGSMGTNCGSLGAAMGGGNTVGGRITISSSGRLKLGGSITSPAGLPKTPGAMGASPTGGGTGGGGYADRCDRGAEGGIIGS